MADCRYQTDPGIPGVEHCVTVRADDFEYLGRPHKSLSSIAREITGTKWNGLVFFWTQASPRANMTLPRAKHHRRALAAVLPKTGIRAAAMG